MTRIQATPDGTTGPDESERVRAGDTSAFIAAALALAAIALAVYWPHIRDGGLYMDDWRGLDAYRSHPGLFDAFARFHDAGLNARPLYALTWALSFEVFGLNTAGYLAASVLGGFIVSLLLTVFARQCGIPWPQAGAMGALLLVFPWSSGLRLWAAAGQFNVSLALFLLGAIASVNAIRQSSQGRSVTWALAGAICYGLCVLHYEQPAALIAPVGVIYFLQGRRARAFWIVVLDAVVMSLAAVFVLASTDSLGQDNAAGTLAHAASIVEQSGEILGRAVLGGSGPWMVGLPLAVGVVLAACIFVWLAPHVDPVRPALRSWLVVAGLGATAVLAGYATLAPAIDWYEPLRPGNATRVNASAAFGWVVLVVAIAMLAALLTTRLLAADLRRASAGALVAVTAIGVGWAAQTGLDARAWATAWGLQEQILTLVKNAGPAKGSTFYVFAPRSTEREVPVFFWSSDLGAALRLSLHDSRAAGAPVYMPSTVSCDRRGPTAHGSEYGSVASEYGAAYFVDPTRGNVMAIANREACQAALAATPPGPVTLPGY